MSTSSSVLARQRDGDLQWYACPGLGETEDVIAAVSSRHGGVSSDCFTSLNLSFAVGDDPERVRENRRRFVGAVGVDDRRVVCSTQVHGKRVVYVDEPSAGAGYADPATSILGVDGLITSRPGLALWLCFADCVPILAYDPVRRAVGIAHAGWRGTLAQIGGELVGALVREVGSRPVDLRVVLGPSIGPCCYAVGSDLWEAFAATRDDAADLFRRDADGCLRLNLWEANRRTLIQAGVPAAQIGLPDLCTACQTDEFYSHRAQHGRAGRIAAMISLPERG